MQRGLVAVLAGAAGTFCAGADLKAVAEGDRRPIPDEGPGPMGPTRLTLRKPVIAAVEGYAVAGGIDGVVGDLDAEKVGKRFRPGESALAICCHDRHPRSPTFRGIASPAAVLLDETGSAAGIFARHRCGRTDQDLNFAIRQDPEQPEAEPSTKVAKPGVAITPPPGRREASGQPNFVASGRPVDPLQDELEIEGQLEFADHDNREIVSLQRDQIAVSNLALDKSRALRGRL